MGILSKKNNIQKQEKEVLRKLVLFYGFGKKRLRQNLQFYGNTVDKKGEIDYIVKSKTNRGRQYSHTQSGSGSVCYKILLSTYQNFKFLGGRYR